MLYGVLQGYIIEYKRVNGTGGSYSLTLQDPTADSYMLINLDTNTSYAVSIKAYNRKGSGPSSQPKISRTYEDGK